MLAKRAVWWSGLLTVSTFRVRWGWRHTGHPILGLDGETFVSIKQTGQGYSTAEHPMSATVCMGICVCGKNISRQNQEMMWRTGKRGGGRVKDRKKQRKRKKDRQREGLSLGLQTTVLFQSWSRMHRARGGSVILFGLHEPEGQQFIP